MAETSMPDPSDHLRVVAVIEARMGSTRLPGTALKPVAGKPVLLHAVERLARSQFIERIAIVTSTDPRDDAIAEFGRANAIAVLRGRQDDVLSCFARAAELFDADIIVRVPPDAPPVDVGLVDHLVEHLIAQNGDYVALEEGVDAFTRRALDKLMMDARDDATARARVSEYFRLHPDFVRVARAPAYSIPTRDLAFVEAVHERLEVKAGEASLADLLLLREAQSRNASQPARGALALIRCCGGGEFGYGHVKRMVALARALRDREGIGAIFALNGTVDAQAPIREAGFEVVPTDSAKDFAALQSMIAAFHPDLLICDMREGISGDEMQTLVQSVGLTAVIDDASDRRLAADIAYYPPVPQAGLLDWTGSHCAPRIGWEWALLGLSKLKPVQRVTSPRPTLLVAMGGSDPLGLTLVAAQALAKLDPVFRARFVIGPGVKDKARVASAVVALAPHFETLEGADDLATEYAAADLALAAFGVTAYELGAYGVPALYLCLNEDHALSASAFEDAGMGLSLGLAERAEAGDISRAVWALLANSTRRREMRAAGLMTVDGEGAARIAADLAAALASARAPAQATG